MAVTLKSFITEEELIKHLGIDEGTLEQLRYRKGFPFRKLGKFRIYNEQKVVEWLDRQPDISDPE